MKLTNLPEDHQNPLTMNTDEQTQPEKQKQKKTRKQKKRGFFARLFSWILGLIFVSALLGAGLGVLVFTWVSRDLPELDRILDYKAAQATSIYARDGSLLGTLSHEKRYVITLNDMPKYLPLAFLAIEDSSFYEHPGINPAAILRAMLVNIERGTKSQGGSTITQQIVKQLLLTSERSYIRKMKEAILATKLERQLNKDQILALYLNYIYLGQHAYGVEAAARTYFGKHASNITLAEAALIAGMPQAPSRYNPFHNPKVAKQRQLEVLGRLHTLKWISEEDYQQAKNEPLVYWSMTENIVGPSQWYFEEARRLLIEFFTPENLKALGIKSERYGEDFVYEAGLTVHTAMDPMQQQLAGESMRKGLESLDKRQGWRGAVRNIASQPERQLFLDKKNFDPNELLGGQWTQGMVVKVNSQGAQVALGKGYIGTISSSDMSWANHRSPYAHSRQGRILNEGDVIWVSSKGTTRNAKKDENKEDKRRPANKKDTKQKKIDPQADNGPQPETPIPLRLQQEPLAQGALVSIEPQTGDVVALIGGYQFGDSHFNRATQARRQPGSSFKPVVYSAALDNGFTPTSTVLDAPVEYVIPGTNKVWRPSNFENSYRGELPLHTALALSRNTPTVRVAKKIGVDAVIERAKILGLEPNFPRVLSISLGAVAVSPLNMAQAYSAFANKGLGVRPRIITQIKDSKGKVLLQQDVEHWQAITPQNAFQMATLLKEVVNRGTGSRARIDGRNIAGKTGTSNDSNDVWFVGFTPYLCTSVYVGYDQMHSLGRQEQGGRTAAPIFRDYRSKADQYYNSSPQDFEKPEGITMSDGLAFNGNANAGDSATDGSISPDNAQTPGHAPLPVDTSQGSEDLMREMF